MRRRKRVEFLVSFVRPPKAKDVDMREYILDAVATWRGSLRPPGTYGEFDEGDPMFDLDGDTVKVKKPRKEDQK